MEVRYRSASIEDLEFLVESRLAFIHLSNSDSDYEWIRGNIRAYFEKGIRENQCDIILAERDSAIIGTGIVFYYDSVPSMFNPLGKNAYITSMYVNEAYRRQGIATTILGRLMSIAKAKNYRVFLLQPSEIGKPLYEKHGFFEGEKGMLYKENT